MITQPENVFAPKFFLVLIILVFVLYVIMVLFIPPIITEVLK
jgi:hypothetical protein